MCTLTLRTSEAINTGFELLVTCNYAAQRRRLSKSKLFDYISLGNDK